MYPMISLQSVVENDHNRNALTIRHNRVESNTNSIVQIKPEDRQHPLAGKKRIEESVLLWVRTFDSLHFIPKNFTELIYSFTLYEMLTEMDATFFPYLDLKLLKLD